MLRRHTRVHASAGSEGTEIHRQRADDQKQAERPHRIRPVSDRERAHKRWTERQYGHHGWILTGAGQWASHGAHHIDGSQGEPADRDHHYGQRRGRRPLLRDASGVQGPSVGGLRGWYRIRPHLRAGRRWSGGGGVDLAESAAAHGSDRKPRLLPSGVAEGEAQRSRGYACLPHEAAQRVCREREAQLDTLHAGPRHLASSRTRGYQREARRHGGHRPLGERRLLRRQLRHLQRAGEEFLLSYRILLSRGGAGGTSERKDVSCLGGEGTSHPHGGGCDRLPQDRGLTCCISRSGCAYSALATTPGRVLRWSTCSARQGDGGRSGDCVRPTATLPLRWRASSMERRPAGYSSTTIRSTTTASAMPCLILTTSTTASP